MALIFNADTGVKAEETAVVRARIAQSWKNAFNTSENAPELNTEPETPAGQLIDGETALVTAKDSELLRMANGFNPQTATGIFQDALAEIYFIERQVSQPTTVTCKCKGLQGTIIPYGAVVQDTSGHTFYNTAVAKIGSDGTCESIFRCSEYGAIEVGAGSVNKIITVVPSWDSVTNETAGVTGRDKETQSEFEQRRFNSVSKNAHGTAAAVEGTVANLDGVIAAKCAENRGDLEIEKMGATIPPHSIYLSVYGGDPQKIGYAVYGKLGGGCGMAGNTTVVITDPATSAENTIYYEVPSAKPIGIAVTYTKTASTAETIEDDIKTAILNNFDGLTAAYSRAKMGSDIYATRFISDVIAAGVDHLISVKIKYDGGELGDMVSIPLDEMPTLDRADIIITEA